MRRLLLLMALLAVPAPAAPAAVRLADEGPVRALAVSRGTALAVVESGGGAEPFGLLRSSGAGVSDLGGFGAAGAEFPDLAVGGDGRALASWGVPVSGGVTLTAVRAPAAAGQSFGDPLPGVAATGPGRLAVDADGAALLAYPDRDGNAALTVLPAGGDRAAARPQPQPLTTSAPERRHLPLGVAAVDAGALVLDLIQERAQTELRVIGPGAPAAPVVSIPALRHVPARLAVGEGRIAVGYLLRGRAHLAVARLGGEWTRRMLRGAGGGEGAPAPMFLSGNLLTAYTQRVRAKGARTQREVFLSGPDGTRRVTETPGDEQDVLAAADPDGEGYVAWTRREVKPRRLVPLLERVD